MLDPASGKFTLISTCFTTHHLIFAEDANHTLWTTQSTRTMFHLEGGIANKPQVVRFQLRPDPLAK